MPPFTDEQLMMFVDDEVGSNLAQAIRAALEHDHSVRRRVAVFTQSRGAMKSAFGSTLMEPPPARLLEPFQNANPGHPRSFARTYGYRLGVAAAALLGLGVLIAHVFSRDTASPVPGPAFLASALESTPSGVPFAAEEGKLRYEITPIKTLHTGDGKWCREFDFAQLSRQDNTRARALACRESMQSWPVRAILKDSVEKHDGYSLASGAMSITGTTISIDQEARVIQNHWQ